MYIFISYSSKNRDFALRLRDQLRAWGHTTWIDVDDIPKGAYWPDEIDKGLAAAEIMVAVFSPNSMDSRPCRNEWDWAIDFEKPLIPLRCQECTIGHRYRSMNYIDFTKGESAGFAQLKKALEAPKPILVLSPTPVLKGVDNRGRLLTKVREFWVEGVLEKAKIGDVWLDLPTEERPEAVEPPIKRELQHPDYETIALESGKQIADVFRRTGRALLILGAPGSGKTMALLELAKTLIAETEADRTKPIPVVINLASWAEKRPEKLEDWLVERLDLDYGVSRKFGARWLEDGELLFLLDGLDEVPEVHRDACVKAINGFWRRGYDWADNGIVVCSRIEEYEKLTEHLHLQTAITLRPLTLAQAEAYLAQLGQSWAELHGSLLTDPILCEFAESPLLLNIMTVAYQGEPKEQITGFASANAQKRHLFEHYVARRLRDDKDHPKYSHANTRHYLAWLAQKMITHDQIVFHIEGLQPGWLDDQQKRRYERVKVILQLAFGFVYGLCFGLVYGRFIGLVGELFGGPVIGLGVGLVVGLVVALFVGRFVGLGTARIEVAERLKWSWSDALRGLVGGLVYGLIIGLGCGLVYKLVFGLVGGLVGGLVVGLIIGPFVGLEIEAVELRTTPNQGICRSVKNAVAMTLGVMLVLGLVGSLVGGLIFGLIIGLVVGLGFGLVIGLHYGGRAVIYHSLLRDTLRRSGDAPSNYTEFLEYTSARHLTRQVGGGFVFRHRMLMEHFAQSDH